MVDRVEELMNLALSHNEEMRDRARLKSAKEDATSHHMEITDAKIAAAEARTDTKFAELLGELRLMNSRLDHVEKSTGGIKSTVIGTGIGVVALVIAVMAYGSQWFGLGMDAQQVSERAVESAVGKVQPQIDALSAGYSQMDGKLDTIIQSFAPAQPKELPSTVPNSQPGVPLSPSR